MKYSGGTKFQAKEKASARALRLHEIRQCVYGTKKSQCGLHRVNKNIENEKLSRGQITKGPYRPF